MTELPKRVAMPTWVKVFIGAGGLVAVALVVMIALGHGPWQHMSMH